MEEHGFVASQDGAERRPLESARRGFDPAIMSGTRFRDQKQFRRSSPGRPAMAHEIAKLLLEKAGTFLERTEAIKAALQMGMPLDEIQEYLDWLDSIRPLRADPPQSPAPDDRDPPEGTNAG